MVLITTFQGVAAVMVQDKVNFFLIYPKDVSLVVVVVAEGRWREGGLREVATVDVSKVTVDVILMLLCFSRFLSWCVSAVDLVCVSSMLGDGLSWLCYSYSLVNVFVNLSRVCCNVCLQFS